MKTRSIFVCAIVGPIACIVTCAAAPIMFASANATQSAAPRMGPGSPDDPKFATFVYDVASIKPHPKGDDERFLGGYHNLPDGFSAAGITLKSLIAAAYYIGDFDEESGATGWIGDERYDVDAKFDPAVADALKQLAPSDRHLARQHMLQMFLKERVNLAARVTTKDVPAFDLVIGKNGTTLKDAPDPNETNHGVMSFSMDQGLETMTGKAVAIRMLLLRLFLSSGRPVFDKTGLTGVYDFKLQVAPERLNGAPVVPGGNAPEGGAGSAADPSGQLL